MQVGRVTLAFLRHAAIRRSWCLRAVSGRANSSRALGPTRLRLAGGSQSRSCGCRVRSATPDLDGSPVVASVQRGQHPAIPGRSVAPECLACKPSNTGGKIAEEQAGR